jgi:hypothetical protein
MAGIKPARDVCPIRYPWLLAAQPAYASGPSQGHHPTIHTTSRLAASLTAQDKPGVYGVEEDHPNGRSSRGKKSQQSLHE